jgi:hypothetical protein
VGYRDGPFHVDLILDARGIHFIEMGFRLSGCGLVGLVEKATGLRWADLSLDAHLDGRVALPSTNGEAPRPCVGQASLSSEEQMKAAERLRERGRRVEIQRFQRLADSGGPEGGQESQSLASDRLRHAGLVGRITLYAGDQDEVRQHLRGCIAPRLEV